MPILEGDPKYSKRGPNFDQAVPGCTRLYQAVIGCTRLYQTVPGCTWLYQAVPGCIKLYQALEAVRAQYSPGRGKDDPTMYLSIISMSKSITTLLTFLPSLSSSQSSTPSFFYLKRSSNPNTAVNITIEARPRAHCRNLLSAVIIALFFRVLGVCQ